MSRRLLAGAVGLAAAAGVAFAPAAHADGGVPVLVLLEGNRIATVSTTDATPTSVVTVGDLGGRELVGIDWRPSNGRVYGVAAAADGTDAALFVLDGDDATLVAPLVRNGTTTPVVLEGDSFGVDFNPVPDALRIVSDTGQNLRVSPAGVNGTGATLVDGRLSQDPCAPAGSATPTCTNPRLDDTGIAAAAYTNSDADPATGTTLRTIDAEVDRLNTQAPPNDGTQVPGPTLGRSTTEAAGFDILGATDAYAVLTQARGQAVSRLVAVDLGTGAVTEIGALGRLRGAIGMAVVPNG